MDNQHFANGQPRSKIHDAAFGSQGDATPERKKRRSFDLTPSQIAESNSILRTFGCSRHEGQDHSIPSALDCFSEAATMSRQSFGGGQVPGRPLPPQSRPSYGQYPNGSYAPVQQQQQYRRPGQPSASRPYHHSSSMQTIEGAERESSLQTETSDAWI